MIRSILKNLSEISVAHAVLKKKLPVGACNFTEKGFIAHILRPLLVFRKILRTY